MELLRSTSPSSRLQVTETLRSKSEVKVMMTRTGQDLDQIRVAVSTVILTLRRDVDGERPRIVLPLVKRTRSPHQNSWALPGGWLGTQENLEDAAARILHETAGLSPSYL